MFKVANQTLNNDQHREEEVLNPISVDQISVNYIKSPRTFVVKHRG